MRGFITAVALVVCIEMLEPLLGLHLEKSATPFQLLTTVLSNLDKIHTPTAIISFCSISFCLLIKSVKQNMKSAHYIPEILILVFTSTLLSWFFQWDTIGVNVLKEIKGGLISPKLPSLSFEKINQLFLSSILISVIGFVESIIVAKTYASLHDYSVSPNRELVALGIGNIFGSFFGAWPAFGSLGRSAVGNSSGSKTQLSGFFSGVLVFFVTCFLLPLFYYLPRPVCSSIIVVAALGLIELHDFIFIWKLRAWNDLGLLSLTFFSTLFFSIQVGTIISVVVSLILVVKHTTRVFLINSRPE